MENHKTIKGLLYSFVGLLFLWSCQNGTSVISNADTVATEDTTSALPPDTAAIVSMDGGTHCFAYVHNQDSVLMKLDLKKNAASGKLIYKLYEKDKNVGTFAGTLRNDTLLADYTFMSEGMRSVRQVIFLLKGDVLAEGVGSMKEHNGKVIFSHKSDIVFNSDVVLEPVDCDSLKIK